MRKIPAALLALTLTASLTAPTAVALKTDSLPELNGHWSQAAFQRWHGYGIVEGDDRGMRPDDAMMVSEFAALLSRTMGYTKQAENHYADLKGDEWYAPYILQLTAAGILQGDGTNCNAEEPMNRERATVLFARALGIRPTAQPDLSGFVDGKDAADWSAGYIDAMAKDGIIQGVGNQTLALGSSITRGSVVKILDSSVAEYAVEEGATIDQDVDGILLVAADDITVDGAAVSGNLLVAPKAGEANLTVKNARLERDLRVSTHGATLTVADSQVEGDVALSGDRASLTLGSGAQLARLAVDGAGSSVSVESGASVETLTARAAVKVDNQGAINKAEVQADNVVLDGKRPAHVEVADDVAPPQNSEGEEVTGSEDSQEPGQGGGGSGGGGGSVSEEAVAGIVGVRPVDQDGVEEDMPSVTAKATKKTGENFVRIALSTDGVVPIHQSEGAGKGAWVGVAIEAPEDYEQGTFQYHFGTEASAEATQSAAITEDSSIGQGKYAVFFLNASSTAPKTHITVKWEGQEAVQYVVDLSGVQTPAVKLTGVTVSTHEMPSGVSSTAEGLSFDGSTALVQNGGTGALTHTQVASMGGGGEYTVYYTVPQAIPGGTLQFDKIARSVNGGKWNAWAMPSTTEANAGSGWWTRDGENYYFKWGAVFAEEAEGSYRLKDGGVFDYTLCFIDTDGSQDNIIATYTFQIDLSGYTISEE